MHPSVRKKLLLALSASAGLIGITGYPLVRQSILKPTNNQSNRRHLFRGTSNEPEDEYIEIPLGTDDLTKEISTPDSVGTANEAPINYSHWVLLSLLKSNRANRRAQAINELARQRSWNDAECRAIAQALDREDIIRLARTADCDGRLFLPPPTLSFIKQSLKSQRIEKMVKSIIKDAALSADECSSCTNFYTNLSIRSRPDASILAINEINQLEVIAGIDPRRQRRNRSALDEDIVRLKAILSNCMCGERQALTMVTSGLMMALHYFRYRFPDNKDVKALISQILSQLSVYESTRDHLFDFGWIKVLVDHSRDAQLEISLPAHKALANLDPDSTATYGSLVYLLSPLTRSDANLIGESKHQNFDVIFVHGLVGSVYKTWRQSYEMAKIDPSWTRCWPKDWLPEDVSDIRVLAIDYPTALSNWRTECSQDKETLTERAHQVMQQLVAAGVGERPIIWVAHSMGGLLVKQVLVNSQESLVANVQTSIKLPDNSGLNSTNNGTSETIQDVDLNEDSNLKIVQLRNIQKDVELAKLIEQTKGVVFYSVPHKGSNLEWIERKNLQKVLMLTTEVIELQKGSSILLKLHEKFMRLISEARTDIRFLTFAETLISRFGVGSVQWKGILVHEDSLQFEVGPVYKMKVDHPSTCKPITKDSICYAYTRDFIREIVAENSNMKQNNDDEHIKALLSFAC